MVLRGRLRMPDSVSARAISQCSSSASANVERLHIMYRNPIMTFTRRILVAALAAGLTAATSSAAFAHGTSGMSSSASSGVMSTTPPGYSSPGDATATTQPDQSSTSSNETSQGATADHTDRATAPRNAPADRLPADRGSSGDTSSSAGGSTSSTPGNANDAAGSQTPDSATTGTTRQPVQVYRRDTTVMMIPAQPDNSGNEAGQPGNDMEHSPDAVTSPSTGATPSLPSDTDASHSGTTGSATQ